MRIIIATLVAVAAVLVLVGIFWLSPARQGDVEKAGERVLSVAAAADLQFALDSLIAEFQQSHPDIRIQVTYGSSGNFFAQLQNQAPFDVFFSADMDYPRRLIDKGLALKDSEFLYAVGHLVVWVPRNSALDLDKLGIQALLDPSVRKIAIANPRFAPYGRAAEAALKSLQVYQQVQERLVFGDNVAQTAQFVQSGAADVGLVGLSQALAPALRETGRYWEIPTDAYPRLEQGGVILSWAKDVASAEAFRAFVIGNGGKAILQRYGFSLPHEEIHP
jgi:molybdate transport system substrate-binding protein